MLLKRLSISIAVILMSVMSFGRERPRPVDSTRVQTVSNHSLSIPLPVLGFEYGYEQKLKGSFSMVFRGGISGRITRYNLQLSGAFGEIGYDAVGVDDFGVGVTVEPRYYTNLNRRQRLGKTTYGNSGDFVAIKLQASVGKPGTTVDISLVPEYGIRRVWGKHWFGELTAGAGVAYNTQDGGYLYFKPQLHYRIAFMFW